MFSLIFNQWTLWVILILGLAGAWGIFFIQKRRDYVIPGVASGIFLVAVLVVYSLGMRYGTNVTDFCVLNGHVSSAVYEESWTEEYTK